MGGEKEDRGWVRGRVMNYEEWRIRGGAEVHSEGRTRLSCICVGSRIIADQGRYPWLEGGWPLHACERVMFYIA